MTTERRLFAAGPDAYAPLLKLLDESEDAGLQDVGEWVSKSRSVTAILQDILEDAQQHIFHDILRDPQIGEHLGAPEMENLVRPARRPRSRLLRRRAPPTRCHAELIVAELVFGQCVGELQVSRGFMLVS